MLGVLVDRHVNGPRRADQGAVIFEDLVGEGEGCCADRRDTNVNRDPVSDKERRFVIALRVNDGEEERLMLEQFAETETDLFQQGLIRVVDQFELVAEEQQPGGVGVVQVDLCAISMHGKNRFQHGDRIIAYSGRGTRKLAPGACIYVDK